MSFGSKLRKTLGINLPEDHIVERSRGCWNCKHWSADKAIDLWWQAARAGFLARAVTISTTSPQGERDPRVMNIRKTIPELDAGMANRVWGTCTQQGKNGSEGDFVHSTYQCGIWSGAQGASLAAGAEGSNKLPQELMEDLNKIN